jgi:hypothetical protein
VCGPKGAKGVEINFKAKDTVEQYLTSLVKAGSMPLRAAQEGIADDWTQYLDAALRYCAVQSCGSEP